jgi:dihydropteroate synthase
MIYPRYLNTTQKMLESIGETQSSAVPSHSHGLTTQGQISWNSLASSAFSATVDVLARVSPAGVDPYTIIVGQKLGGIFRMPSKGRLQIIDARESCKGARFWVDRECSHRCLAVALTTANEEDLKNVLIVRSLDK